MTTLYERYRKLRDSFRACFERDEWWRRTEDEHGEPIDVLTVDAQRVLVDLRTWCRANESTFDIDARVHALREGRRETLLRIQAYLNLSDTDLMKLQDPDHMVATTKDENP